MKGACYWRNSASWRGKTLVGFLYRGVERTFNRSRLYLLFGIDNKRYSTVLAWYMFPAVILTGVKALPSSAQTIYKQKLTGCQLVRWLSAMSITLMCTGPALCLTEWSCSITLCVGIREIAWKSGVRCSGASMMPLMSMMHQMVYDHHCQHSGALRVPVDPEVRIGGSYVLRLYSGFCTSLQYHFSYNTCKTPHRRISSRPALNVYGASQSARRWV